MPKYTKTEKTDAVTRLHELVKPGDTVLTVLRHTSRSGMSRDIDLYVVKDGDIYWLSALAAKVLDMSLTKGGHGIRIGGCGMDMGFQLVYLLSSVLYRGEQQDKHGELEACQGGHGQSNLCGNIRCRSQGYWLKHRWM